MGTARTPDEEDALSSQRKKLNERFGTDFTAADQLTFDQIRACAEQNDKIVKAAWATKLTNFSSYLDRMLDALYTDRMEGNEKTFSCAMADSKIRAAAHKNYAREIYCHAQRRDPAEDHEELP